MARILIAGILIGLGIFTTLIIAFLPVAYLVYLIANSDYPIWTLAPGFVWSIFVILCLVGLYTYAEPQTKNKQKSHPSISSNTEKTTLRKDQWTKL